MLLDDLAIRARSLATTNQPAILGIVGAPGSGKSTLADRLVARLRTAPPGEHDSDRWVAHVPMDGYHLADAELIRLGRRERKGAPDTFDADGYAELLRRLRSPRRGVIYAPNFSRDLDQPIAGSIAVYPEAKLVITEGNYLLLPYQPWLAAARELTETWFCSIPDEVRIERLIARHEAFGKSAAEAAAWVLGPDQHNADVVAQTAVRADVIIPMETLEFDSSE